MLVLTLTLLRWLPLQCSTLRVGARRKHPRRVEISKRIGDASVPPVNGLPSQRHRRGRAPFDSRVHFLEYRLDIAAVERGYEALESLDVPLCVMQGVFTQAERTLIGAGSGEHVRESRLKFQDALRSEFVAIAERVTGRTVRVFISQVDPGTDVAAELFLFEEQPMQGDEEDRDGNRPG